MQSISRSLHVTDGNPRFLATASNDCLQLSPCIKCAQPRLYLYFIRNNFLCLHNVKHNIKGMLCLAYLCTRPQTSHVGCNNIGPLSQPLYQNVLNTQHVIITLNCRSVSSHTLLTVNHSAYSSLYAYTVTHKHINI